VADDPDETLPGLTLLLAQWLTEVREHEQLVWPAALPKLAAPDLPSAHAPGKCRVDDPRHLTLETIRESNFLGVPAEQPLGRLVQQARARAVDELELLLLVEREHGDVDLGHHLSQERRGFERVEALVPERLDEGVHFDHDLAERIAAARAPRPDREVAFPERCEEVREGLQGKNHALAEREGEAETDGHDDDRERPLHFRGVVAGPEENQRNRSARQR
jgi:hypothetical protein